MRAELQEKITMFHAVNDITMQGEIVVFGSTFMANFPFYELSKKYVMENAVYNRSIENLTLAEAETVLNECVFELRPQKVFLSLGETDIADPAAPSAYARILKKIRQKLPKAKIYVLPVKIAEADNRAVDAFNRSIQELAVRYGAETIDFPPLFLPLEKLYEKIFKRLRCFFRDKPPTFIEAFVAAY